MAKRPRRPKDERLAIHEAGHAVMAYVQRLRFEYVTIVPTEECAGRVMMGGFPMTYQPDVDSDRRTDALTERHILVTLGGPAAEVVIVGRRSPGDGGDWHSAVELGMYVQGNAEVVGLYIDYLYGKAKAILRLPWHQKAVKVLAAELLKQKTIKYRAARQIIKEAIDRGSGNGAVESC